MGHGKMFSSTGHGHIAQPPLFLHFLLVTHGAVTGEQAILHAHHKYLREFQPLGTVHGHQHHAVFTLFSAVQIGIQCHLIQKTRQGGIIRLVVQKSMDAGGQLLHVFQTSPTLHIILFRQHRNVAAAVADKFVKLRQRQFPCLSPHFFYQFRKGFQPYSRRFQFRIVRGMATDLI